MNTYRHMRTNWKTLIIVLLIFSVIGYGYYFWIQEEQITPRSSVIVDFSKVDDYPLYIGRYVGDYSLDEYKESGTWPQLGEISCTCFVDGLIFGRNFDFPANPALLLWTYPEDGYKSVSMVDLGYFGYSMAKQPKDPTGLEFTPYLPFDGMNEKGLVVGMAAISHADPPSLSSKVSIGEIEVIRMLLDYASNVEEAIELLDDYNILMTEPPIHYLVADASGDSVIIEFLDNEMKLYTSFEFQIITNFLVSRVNLPEGSPCNRYDVVYSGIEDNNGDMYIDYAFSLLDASSQSSTIWSVVYDIEDLTVHVAMGGEYTQILSFELLESQ